MGVSLALEGSTLVAGAPNDANAGSTPSAAYVFLKPGGGWANTTQPAARLTPSDPLGAEHFGESVGVSGTTVVVGAQFAAFEKTAQQGAVYLYNEPGGGWASTSSQAAKLSAAGGGLQQAVSVGVSGTTIIEAADLAKVGTHEAQGAAYVFGGVEGSKEEPKKEPTKEEAKTTPTVTPPGETTLHYVPKPTYTPPELGWGDIAAGLFGIEPGSEQTVNWGEFVFIARCKKPTGCKGSATLTGTGTGHTTAVQAKAKPKAPPVYAKVSFSVAGNASHRVVLKLSKAAGATLRKKHKLSGVLTVTVTRPGQPPATLSHALTIHLVSKKKKH